MIEAVHRCGYKLIAPVRAVTDSAPDLPAGTRDLPPIGRIPPRSPVTIDQQIRFATTPGGVRLAYAMLGRGPMLIKAANWLNHLDFDWHTPIFRHWLTELGRDYRLVRFVGLESHNHLLLESEPAWPVFLDKARRFLGS